MKKKLLVALLAIIATLCCALCFTACGGNNSKDRSGALFFYKLSDEQGNEFYVTGCKRANSWSASDKYPTEEECEAVTELEIPATFNKLPVKGLSDFSAYKNLKKVTLPDTIEFICDNCFEGCSLLSSIELPDGVIKIGEYAFSDCTSLTSISIPYGVTSIENRSFRGCTSLTSISIPESVTEIGEYAFRGCTSLTSITIPESVTEIGYKAFIDCTSLTSITIPDGVTSIESWSFRGCTSLTSITIPESVTEIGEYAFSDCTSLTSITIPDGVTSIESWTFNGCTSLTSISIPDSVITIEYNAFNDCENIKEATIPAFAIDKFATENLETLTITSGESARGGGSTKLKKVTLCEGVISIAYSAFENAILLTEIIIPNSVIQIDQEAFKGCTGIDNIVIPDSVTKIEYRAFSGCSGLTSVSIGNGVTEIGDEAFSDCTSLEYVNYTDDMASKSNLTTIGNQAFRNCKSLINFAIPEKVTTIGSQAFDGCDAMMGVFLSASNLSNCYPAFAGAGNNSKSITLRVNKTVKIMPRLMAGCKNLLEVIFDNDCRCTEIDAGAFAGCVKLNSVSFNEYIEKINSSAFANCYGLIRIYFPASLKYIAQDAFTDCDKLVEIYNLSNVEITAGDDNIGKYARKVYSTGLSAVFKSGNFTFFVDNSTGKNEYYLMGINNKFATDITLPSSVIMYGSKVSDTYKIYDYAFAYSNITSVTIPDNILHIGKYAFYETPFYNNADNWSSGLGLYIGNHLIRSVSDTIKEGTLSIADNAFDNFRGDKITIPSSVKLIGYDAFANCKEYLKQVSFDNVSNWTRIAEYDNSVNPVSVSEIIKNEDAARLLMNQSHRITVTGPLGSHYKIVDSRFLWIKTA